MIKKTFLSKLLSFFVAITFLVTQVPVAIAAEVPFEVVKTKVIADITMPTSGSSSIVINGKVYPEVAHSPDGSNPDLPTEPPPAGIDSRVKVPIEGINYRMEFWNVGAMGGEKGFIFKSSYEKAKLTIEYVTGQAYKMVPEGESFGGFQMEKKVEVSTPNIDTLEFDLNFSGGPYGAFTLNEKNMKTYLVGRVVAGDHIKLESFNVNEHLVYEYKATPVIEGDGFVKWMELIGENSECKDPSDSTTDSGKRFNDYNGYVSVYPCDDDEDEKIAEIDMVLHRSDTIITHEDSFADIAIPNYGNFHMGPESKVFIDYSSGKRDLIKLVTGKIKANVEELIEDGTMTVEMSQAVAGIKGTIFIVEETGTGSTLKVIEGLVEFTSNSTGKSEMIGTGESITATSEGLQKKETFDIEKEKKVWEELEDGNFENVKIAKGSGGNSPTAVLGVIAVVLASIGYVYFKKKKSKQPKDEEEEVKNPRID